MELRNDRAEGYIAAVDFDDDGRWRVIGAELQRIPFCSVEGDLDLYIRQFRLCAP
ncbi:hypothetical protein D3C87_1919390 [compost metagenome]